LPCTIEIGIEQGRLMEHRQVRTNGIDLHVIQDGPRSGRLVILLHGFPNFWYGWRRQIPYLAAAGYRVSAPGQRGYNLSAKPAGIASYTLDELASDVIGLVDAAARENAFVVGHDWGGAVAWWLAATCPERLVRMVVINCPHGAVLTKHLRHSFVQMRKSWYMFFFQLPRLPGILLRWNNGFILAQTLKNSSRPGTFANQDPDRYRRAGSKPGPQPPCSTGIEPSCSGRQQRRADAVDLGRPGPVFKTATRPV
jgi:pimeloyl-ACP methyl ester carboxylesterase